MSADTRTCRSCGGPLNLEHVGQTRRRVWCCWACNVIELGDDGQSTEPEPEPDPDPDTWAQRRDLA